MRPTLAWRCRSSIMFLLATLPFACASPGTSGGEQKPEQAVAPSPDAPQPSALSYGAVTSQVKKGVTTQVELAQLFGGPNIATTDADGLETWVYDRSASQTETSYQETKAATAQAEVNRLGVFFGLGVAGKDSAKASGNSQSSGKTTVVHSVKAVTVIIKFNPDKTVKDYSVRSASF